MKKGFTLIELVVVVAIIIVLAAVAVSTYSSVIGQAENKIDENNVYELNRVTTVYSALNNTISSDVFSGLNSNEDRVQELMDVGLLAELPDPKQEDAQYNWIVESQIWTLSGGTVTPDPGGSGSEESYGEHDYYVSLGLDTSTMQEWDPSATYAGSGHFVKYSGKVYYNRWYANPGNIPGGILAQWNEVSEFYVPTNVYLYGETTVYEGHTYSANWYINPYSGAPSNNPYSSWTLIN